MPLDPGQESPLSALFIFPVDQSALSLAPAPGLLLSGIPLPDRLSRGSVEGKDLTRCRRGVENPPDDQVVGLILRLVTRVMTPGKLQRFDIFTIDLSEGREQVALLASQIDRPVLSFRTRSALRRAEKYKSDCAEQSKVGFHGNRF